MPSTGARRCVCTLFLTIGVCGIGQAQTAALPATPLQVTLLGTGSPAVSLERFSSCILVQAGGRRFLFDAGRACLLRLQQARVDLASVAGIFITHLHSDHILSVPDLFLTSWVQGKTNPFKVWGPVGTKEMVSHLVAAYAFDIEARVRNGRARPQVEVTEVAPGVVFDEGGVVVRAFEVDHGEISPAFGYRVDVAGRSVALSGDTRPSDGLVRAAAGVDVLVHEVALGSPKSTPQQKYVLDQHTSPTQAAEIFGRVKPRLAIYSHIILQAGATDAQVLALTRERYQGRVEVATDLTVVRIDSEVTINRPDGMGNR